MDTAIKSLPANIGAMIDKAEAEGMRLIEDRRRFADENYTLGEAIVADDRRKLFNVLSLRDWNAVADKAGVLRLPAELLGSVEIDTPFHVLDNEALSPDQAKAWEAIEAALNMVADDTFVRWDHCAGMSVKMSLSDGKGLDAEDDLGHWRNPETGRRFVVTGDIRVMDMLADYPGRTIPIFARPRVQTRMLQGIEGGTYPAEWRVYVMDGRVRGISNYYPQLARQDNTETRAAAHLVARQAIKLINTLRTHAARPHHTAYDSAGVDMAQIHCTLDFIEGEDGHIYMVEGGPAHLPRWGAHPCCFAKSTPEIPLEGWALSTTKIFGLDLLSS